MVSDEQFLSSFPFLKNLGIESIKQVKEKLKFEGKINSETEKIWHITGISYPMSLLELFLIIRNGHEEYKITYIDRKGKNDPIIISREKVLLRNFELSIKNEVIEIIENSENITIFPFKKAS